jgi:hypothetical protein
VGATRAVSPISPQNRNGITVYFVSWAHLQQELLLSLKECNNMILAFEFLLNHTYGMRASGSLSWSTSFALFISLLASNIGVAIEETSIKCYIIGRFSSFRATNKIGNITAARFDIFSKK